MNYQKNQILTVDIHDVNMLGFGVAKVDGAVFFVQNAVKGDRANIRIIKATRKYYVARIEELLVSSPHRITPDCPSHRRCGGCAFQHLSYSLEKEIKKGYVASCIQKSGLQNVFVIDVLSTDCMIEYRNKGQFPVAENENGECYFGFYSPKTHRVVSLGACNIQNPLFTKIASFVCDFLNQNKIPAYSEPDGRGLVRHIYLRSGSKTGEIMLCLVLKEDGFSQEDEFVRAATARFPQIKSIYLNFNPKNTNVILGQQMRLLWGEEKISDVLCDRTFYLSPHSFFQVNPTCAQFLYQTAFEMAQIDSHDLILDLYCGIGSIGLSTHTKADLVGVEIIPEAVEDARFNARVNQIHNARFICGDAADAFSAIGQYQAKNPIVIVDPPRKGLSPSLIFDLAKQNIKKILYISCAPDTLCRDLKQFQDLGYRISNLQPVDMFPRTSHVETVAVIDKL